MRAGRDAGRAAGAKAAARNPGKWNVDVNSAKSVSENHRAMYMTNVKFLFQFVNICRSGMEMQRLVSTEHVQRNEILTKVDGTSETYNILILYDYDDDIRQQVWGDLAFPEYLLVSPTPMKVSYRKQIARQLSCHKIYGLGKSEVDHVQILLI